MFGQPLYWQQETSGKLKEAVLTYVDNKPLNESQILSLKLYFQQWISASAWEPTDEVIDLRYSVEKIATVKDIDNWVEDAIAAGVDPL